MRIKIATQLMASLILIVNFLIIQCFLSPVSAFPGDATIIKDALTSPDSGWTEYSDAFGALTYDENGLSLFIKKTVGKAIHANYKIGELDDFIAEVDIREFPPPRLGYVGLVFRWQDNQNHYAFQINNRDRTYRVIKLTSDISDVRQPWTSSNYINSGANRLKIICKGPQIEVYSNGEKLCTVRDASMPKGLLGFIVDTQEGPQTYLFSNLTVVPGVTAGFVAAECFRGSKELDDRLKAVARDGFDVDKEKDEFGIDKAKIEYYPTETTDFSPIASRLMASEPVVIYVMCRPPELPEIPSACAAINSALKNFGVDVRPYEVADPNSLEFSILKPTTSQVTYRGGQTLQIFTGINNTGVQDIALATVTLNITDPNGTRVPTSTSEWKTIPAGKESQIPISYDLPLVFLKAGEYTASLEITGYADTANKKISRTENATVTFEVVESISTINYVLLPLFALLTGAMIAWIVTRRKSSKE